MTGQRAHYEEALLRYLFKHILMRDAVYDMQLRWQLRELHRRAAEVIEAFHISELPPYYADLAYHYERAGVSQKAIKYLHKAGDYARKTYAVKEAVDHYQRALIALASSDAPRTSGFYMQQVALYAGLGEVLWWQAQYTRAIEAYRAMRTAAETAGDDTAQAQAWNALAKVQDSRGDFRAVLESARQAKKLARSANARIELAKALYGEGWALHRLGDDEAALTVSEEALALSRELDSHHELAHSLNLSGQIYVTLGDHKRADRYVKRALDLFRELEDQVWVVFMLSNLGENARKRGEYRVAIARYQNALTVAVEIGFRDGELVCRNNLGGAYAGLGLYETAEANLYQVIQTAEDVGATGFLSETYRFLAEALLGQKKDERSLAAAGRALTLARETGSGKFAGAAWRVLGRIAARSSVPVQVDGEMYGAADCFAESLCIFDEKGSEAEQARTLRSWARYELERGDRKRGERMLQKARKIFERVGINTNQPTSGR